MIAIVNVYNFIRMSHKEPSEFIQADFDTISRQIHVLKQYGLPSTYALKYDALMNPQYQELMRTATDENDEISVWWEITSELCKRAGVPFQGIVSDVFDERVGSAYSVGYTPEERCKLVDAYMADFHEIFGYYPKTMGSWILDNVTISYAQKKYGIIGIAICRDQIGTDGFTLWGGWPNGLYLPSKENLYIPSQTKEGTMPVTMFRLLGPDPILCFEQNVREGISGVYSLEPTWYSGRDQERISWFFSTITENEGAGIGYAQVGQENNFLWENIRPGFEPQVKLIQKLSKEGKLRIETMEESATWFQGKYKVTPPLCWQASVELDSKLCVGSEGVTLDAQWYASRFFRLGFLAEGGHLRIRDWFLFREQYACRYLNKRIETKDSIFDALPLVFAQEWGCEKGRPYVRIMEQTKTGLCELQGEIHFCPIDEYCAYASLKTEKGTYEFTLKEDSMQLKTKGQPFVLHFDTLPVYKHHESNKVHLVHEGFSYDFVVQKGTIQSAGTDGMNIVSEDGEIFLLLSGKEIEKTELFTTEYLNNPTKWDQWVPRWIQNPLPLANKPLHEPIFSCKDSCFDLAEGAKEIVVSTIEENASICYEISQKITQTNAISEAFLLNQDAKIKAYSTTPDGRISEAAVGVYRFGWKDVKLESSTNFDWRPVFDGRGISGLLKEERGSEDWQDRHWIATLEHLDFICELPEERLISVIELGFLTNHRSGIIYPELLELYVGEDKEHLELFDVIRLPEGPANSEIERKDFGFAPNVRAKCIRFVAKRYDLMPQWCCYKGISGIFTMVDCLIIH